MGMLEKKSAGLSKRTHVRDSILLTLYTASALTLVVLAPNAARLLKHVDPDFAKKRKAEHRIKEATKRLESRGFLRRTKGGLYSLTARGHRVAQMLEMKRVAHSKKRAWDGKWRIVIFDVWERRKHIRERLRTLLIHTGFIRLQDSVWVYPYPCEELVALIRAELALGGGMQYIIAESIEGEQKLRKHFGLPY